MFQPIIPVIRDAYAHTFGEAIHLATIHAIYGSRHLEKKMAAAGEANKKDQKNNNSGESYRVHVGTPAGMFATCFGIMEVTYPFVGTHELSTVFLSTLVPPPKS